MTVKEFVESLGIEKEEIMSLVMELVIRVVIIVSLIDTAIFYLISKHLRVLTVPFEIGIIIITILVLVLNIGLSFYRRKIK